MKNEKSAAEHEKTLRLAGLCGTRETFKANLKYHKGLHKWERSQGNLEDAERHAEKVKEYKADLKRINEWIKELDRELNG